METSNSPRCVLLSLHIVRKSDFLPSGTPHRLMEDDVYNGWFIPAGSTIIENTWYATGLCGTF